MSRHLRRDLERQGYVVRKTNGGHWRITRPDMAGPVFASDTPSCHRAEKNLLADIRRQQRSKQHGST